MRVVFMGSPDFAVHCLDAVHRACEVPLVLTQPDRPAGRGRKLMPPPVKARALELGLPVLQPTKMRDGAVASALREVAPDLAVVVAFGRILPPDVLAVPTHGCVNIHASLLPRWRGAAPIQRAILAGDRETGVSVMAMDEGLDTGAVYETVTTEIRPEETSGELFERLAELGAGALESFLRQPFPRPLPEPQPEGGVTYADRLEKSEAPIDWSRTAEEVSAHIRGMDPWPVAETRRRGQRLRTYGAVVEPHGATDAPPGTVLGVNGDGLAVACSNGSVRVRELQPDGKRRMPAQAYAAGRAFAEGERLGHAGAGDSA